jgi:hypothetical protein
MRSALLIALAFMAAATGAKADPCVNGAHVGNPHCRPLAAPAPELGTGILGFLIIAGGLYAASRRRNRQSQ